MRSPLFDELRILLNFEMDSKDPLLLILAGQPQLLAKLALRVHLPFRQRVAMRYRMPAMDEKHTRGYVEHQLKLAGRRQRLFTDEALTAIWPSPPCTTPPRKTRTSSNSTTSSPPARRSPDAQPRSPYVFRS
jgi:type II secretory pathway predicted ATPase ExeA